MRRAPRPRLALLALAAVATGSLLSLGCGEAEAISGATSGTTGGGAGGTGGAGSGATGGGGSGLPGTPLEAEAQREGDPTAGYAALVNNGYVSCGIPYSAYSQVFGDAPEDLRLPGRTGHNETLPYNFTAFVTKSGVEVVGPNCLSCHAGHILGKLTVGLGAADGDFTTEPSGQAGLAGVLLSDPAEKAELNKFVSRLKAIAPYIKTTTIGANPADNLAAALFAHRDQKTLAWSDEPLLALPPEHVLPVDVPPWWRMAKKNAMFYVAGGRGDHARIMMTASTLCTDTVDEAKAIDAYFNDVAAFIRAIEPPKYPFPIDGGLAEEGRAVFESVCSTCHGTYGEPPSYPNLVVAVEDVGTDPALATGSSQFADVYVDWFNGSFYGETARLEPQKGYVPPPLDGVWATAPYLHNGSVPTLAMLLDSKSRPEFWTRSFDSNDYDAANVGWNVTVLAAGKDAEPNATTKKAIYDATQLGYSNTGHVYGDGLSAEERKAVIEYLKTL